MLMISGMIDRTNDMKKLKVVWICHFSNEKIRSRLTLTNTLFKKLVRTLAGKPKASYSDFANWISHGIIEFEKFQDAELHVIAPHYGMKHNTEKLSINGINYWFFKPDDDSLLKKGFKKLTQKADSNYKGNRKIVQKTIESIQPDIIHMYGAENPYYSITALDVDIKQYPFIVSLQTLMNDPEFKLKYRVSSPNSYDFRAGIEKDILSKLKYIGTTVNRYREFIWNNINSKAIFTKTFLATAPHITLTPSEKKFDFVYFAASITKAADFAVEAFALACQKHPGLTLNIVGHTPNPFTKALKTRIKELGLEKNIVFSGKLKTHDDVFKRIRLAKIALLPQKISNAPGTIREAMFCGLPVVTKASPSTTILNEKRESVLLSDPDDHQAMANNMIKLIESPDFAKKLADNSLITARERWNNEEIMLELVAAYRAIIDHHQNGTPIPDMIGAVNRICNHK